MNIEELNIEYKNKMDALMDEYKAKVKEVVEKEQPFKKGQKYFTIDNWFRILATKNYDCEDDIERIQIGNYYPFTDENRKEVCEKVSLTAERKKLQNQMEMFARLNNEGKIDWNDCEQEKWFLCINYNNNVVAGCHSGRYPNVTYYTSREVAEKALEKFGDRIRELYLKEGEE